MTNPLTDQSWTKRETREKGCDDVGYESPESAKWLKQLLDRETILKQTGNAYGEKYSSRQVALAVGPIVQREHIRGRILMATRDKGMTLVELGAFLEMEPRWVLGHVVALRKKGQLVYEKFDGRTPIYRAAVQKVES